MTEQQHLQETLARIRENIQELQARFRDKKAETAQLTEQITPRDRESNSQLFMQLTIASSLEAHLEGMLRKNLLGEKSPYFGRIDFEEIDTEDAGRLKEKYIGKNGIQYHMEPLVVDWRAPLSKLYYENELGPGSYPVPEEKEIQVDLKLKRTFDIENGVLVGYYDSDIAANDELLIKYLAKNKNMVLDDIIATIQQEQNRIIRETPFMNILVQGVAGSGKTTVALHRISHILYNYSHRYQSRDFLIVGGNKVLLSYITSGLPELDVGMVSQYTMEELMRNMAEDTGALEEPWEILPPKAELSFKGSLTFLSALEKHLRRLWLKALRPEEVTDEALGELMSRDWMYDWLNRQEGRSLRAVIQDLRQMLMNGIQARCHYGEDHPEYDYYQELKKKKRQQYNRYFEKRVKEKSPEAAMGPLAVYRQFLLDYCREEPLPAGVDVSESLQALSMHRGDVYDLAALSLCGQYLTQIQAVESYGQVFIDEAQDFGPSVYLMMRRLMKNSYFTIMGDVSQNIQGSLGMDSWTELRDRVFTGERNQYRELRKSYRNTIEISHYAAAILREAGFGELAAEPVIRHGREVEELWMDRETMDAALPGKLAEARNKGYQSLAVICRDEKTAEAVAKLPEMEAFQAPSDIPVMILPVEMVKGLEFDYVILYDAPVKPKGAAAKRFYVAATRALHELVVLRGKDR